METPGEGNAGYPEEAPEEVADDQDESSQREGSQPDEGGEHGEGGSPGTESETH